MYIGLVPDLGCGHCCDCYACNRPNTLEEAPVREAILGRIEIIMLDSVKDELDAVNVLWPDSELSKEITESNESRAMV
jgi:hypothetical protein